VTSLGPAYIKLGQALSIRPDILSPSAMTELQKLCDKVKSLVGHGKKSTLSYPLPKLQQVILSNYIDNTH
jgi:predicted unusual protein kinase regulating ubiquinone biosynthesis (AarF/ABC1/UbiB family)